MKLTDKELFELIHLTQRPGMYIGNSEIKSIESFLIGYDFGRKGEVRIHRQLIKFIFDNHRNIKEIAELEKRNVHLLQLQLDILSNELDKTEFQIFKEETMKFFINVSDNENKSQYKNYMKNEIIEILKTDLSQIDLSTNKSIISSRIGSFAKQINEWQGKNFDDEIIEQLNSLNKLQIEKQVLLMRNSNTNDINSKIISASNSLLERLRTDKEN